MQEIEVKILEINTDETIKKLVTLGAKKIFEGPIYAVSYDFEDNKLTKDQSFVRLRKKGNKNFLTFKKKISQEKAKIMDETETEVGDFKETNKILLNLGLKPANDYKKNRITYQIANILFEFDSYEDLAVPTYLEIEAPDIETIDKYIELLKLNKENVKTWNGKQVLDHYGLKNDFARI